MLSVSTGKIVVNKKVIKKLLPALVLPPRVSGVLVPAEPFYFLQSQTGYLQLKNRENH